MESVFFREVNYYINFFYYVLDNVIYSTNSISKFWLLHDIKRKVELSPSITITKKNKKHIPVISKFYYILTSEIRIDISIKIK
jgi:hypothetical protein